MQGNNLREFTLLVAVQMIVWKHVNLLSQSVAQSQIRRDYVSTKMPLITRNATKYSSDF